MCACVCVYEVPHTPKVQVAGSVRMEPALATPCSHAAPLSHRTPTSWGITLCPAAPCPHPLLRLPHPALILSHACCTPTHPAAGASQNATRSSTGAWPWSPSLQCSCGASERAALRAQALWPRCACAATCLATRGVGLVVCACAFAFICALAHLLWGLGPITLLPTRMR